MLRILFIYLLFVFVFSGEFLKAQTCIAPVVQPTALSFSGITSGSVTIQWVNGAGDGRIVLISTNQNFTLPGLGDNPIADTLYNGGQQCVYNGNGNAVVVTGLSPNTQYYVAVLDFCIPDRNYNLSLSPGNNNYFVTACPLPMTQASNLAFPVVNHTNATVTWTNGNGQGRVVYINRFNSFTPPAPLSNPTASTLYLGPGQQCIYNGTGAGPVTVIGLVHNTRYYVRVYEYCDSSRQYYLATSSQNPGSFLTPRFIVTASDCDSAENVCSDDGFTILPSGFGNRNELDPFSNYISNPSTNPMPGNLGCLTQGEVNSTWLKINIFSSGTLQFSLGSTSQSHLGRCYDWILWRYDSTACNRIYINALPPLRCNFNGNPCQSYTGMANPVPSGGLSHNFEQPLQVNCGDQYILCFSNYAGDTSEVPLRFFGSAVVGCGVPPPFRLTTSADTVCSNQPFTLTATGSVDGVYNWSFTTPTSSQYFPLSGTSAIRNESRVTSTTYEYVVSGNTQHCGVAYDTVRVHVLALIRNNSVGSAQTICSGSQPNLLTGAVPNTLQGGNGVYTYQWESSTDSISWSTIVGQTQPNYLPPTLTSTHYFRRIVTSNACSDISLPIRILVLPLIGANTIQDEQTICFRQTPAPLTGSLPTGGNGAYTYQWQSSRHAVLWANISGATLQHYAPPALDSTTYYRRMVSSGPCVLFPSDTVEIWVHSLIDSNLIASAQTICAGDAAALLTGSVPIGGSGQYLYQWQSALRLDTVFAPVAGATQRDYNPGILYDTTGFRRIVISGPCRDTSDVIRIHVHTPISGNSISSPQTICAGQAFQSLTGTQPGGGSGQYTYIWQSSHNAILWQNLSNHTQSGYTGFVLHTSTYFRRIVVSPPCASDTSATLQILVDLPLGNNQIVSHQTICRGTSPQRLMGSIPTGGRRPYMYQWQSSLDASVWSDIPTGVDSSLLPGVLLQSTYFRRVMSGGACPSHTSAWVFITVRDTISQNIIGNSQSLCSGAVFTSLTGSVPTGGSGVYVYQWQSSSNQTVWTNLPGSVQTGLTGYMVSSSVYFRRVVTSAICPTVSSQPVVIEIQLPPGNNQVGSSQTLCLGQTAQVLTGTQPSGGSGTYAYIWETSLNQSLWATAGTGASYSPGMPQSNTYYRRIVSSGVCTPVTGNVVSITVLPAFGNNVIGSAQTICIGQSPQMLTGLLPTGGSGSYTYQWQSSSTGSGWSNIPGATQISFTPSIPASSIYYRRYVLSGQCEDFSTSIMIRVQLPIGQNVIATHHTICEGSIPTIITGTTPTGGNAVYTYQWEQSLNNSIWAVIPGATQSQYAPPALTLSQYYRRVVSSLPCAAHTAAAVYIHVEALIGNNILTPNQSICTGQSIAQIWGSSPTGGTGSYTFSWESSLNQTQWNPLSPAVTTANFPPVLLTQNTYFRRRVSSGVCPANLSAANTITVFPVIIHPAISADQTLCSGSLPLALSGAAPGGGSGTYTYIWESSANGSSWGVISGANLISYAPLALTSTTYYRRIVQSSPCAAHTGNVVILRVESPITGNSVSGNQTLCSGQTAALLSGTTPLGGSGIYSYQWESGVVPGVWQAITGANGSQFAPGVMTQSTYFRRMVTSGVCAPVSGNMVSITVLPGITGNMLSAAQTLCLGATAQMLSGSSPTGGSGSYQYQWESSIDLLNWQTVSGQSSSTYAPGVMPASRYFRRIVTSGSCQQTSNVIGIEITPLPGNNLIAGNVQVCSGQAPVLTGSLPTGGMGQYFYQWESSTDNSVWHTIAGASTQNYSVGSMTQVLYFRRAVTALPCTPIYSNVSQILILPLIGNNAIGNAQTICSGTVPISLSGSMPSGGTGTYAYQWESASASIGPWTAIASGTNAGFIPGILTDTVWFRRQVSSLACQDVSPSIRIAVHDVISNNHIGTGQTICQGSQPAILTGSIPSGGNLSYVYAWESSATGSVWTTIPGAVGQQYTVPVLQASAYYRRVVFSAPCSPHSSNPVWLQVDILIGQNALQSAQTLCAGQQAAIITGSAPSGGNFQYTYVWQSSTDLSNWASVSGESASNLQPPVLFQNTYYRRIVSAGVCQAHIGLPLSIAVFPAIQQNTIASPQTICFGSIAAILTGSAPSGGDGMFTFQWESSSDFINWQALAGQTQSDFVPGILFSTRYYRRAVASSACSVYSNGVQIEVLSLIGNNTISSHQTLCTGEIPAMLSGSMPTGSFGTYTWQWEFSMDNSTWADIPGATLQHYSPAALNQTTYYRRRVSSMPCNPIVSNTVQALVLPLIGNNVILNDQTLCEGSTAQIISGSMPSGGNQSYTYAWQSATSPTGSWITIPNTNQVNYAPGSIALSSYFRRQAVSHTCTSTSQIVSILTNPAISNNSIGNNQTLCTGSQPLLLTGSIPQGGNGGYAYQWESSLDNVSWSSLPGAVVAGYQPPVLSQTVFYRRSVRSLPCPDHPSAAVVVVVEQLPGNNIISPAQTLCAGQLTGILTGTIPTGGNGLYAYQWQSSSNLSSWANMSASTQSVMLPETLFQSTYFRRVLSSGLCPAHTSAAISVQVFATITHNTIGNSQTLCLGDIPAQLSGTQPQGGNLQYQYQWLSSQDAFTWNQQGGATQQDYQPSALSASMYFRRLVMSSACIDSSNFVYLHAEHPVGQNAIASHQTICSGQMTAILTGTNPSGGNHTYVYSWQSTQDLITWHHVAGANSSTLPGFVPLTSGYYRRVVSSGVCPASTSQNVFILMLPGISGNVISPNQTLCAGSMPVLLTGTMPSGGSGNYTYQWLSSNQVSGPWAVYPGAVFSNWQSPVLMDSLFLRRVVSSGGVCADSGNVAELIVNPVIGNNTLLQAQTICSLDIPQGLSGSIPSGGNGIFTYVWMSSDGISAPMVISGATQRDYSPGALAFTHVYQRIVSAGVCAPHTSDPLQVKVDSLIGDNTIGNDQTLCSGQSPMLFTGAIPSGGNGIFHYAWEYSQDSLIWSSITGASSVDYQQGSMTQNGYFRRIVQAGVCTPHTALPISVWIDPPILSNQIQTNQTICIGDISNSFTGTQPIGGNGVFQFVWESSVNTTQWNIVPGETQVNLSPQAPLDTTYYRRIVLSRHCQDISAAAVLIVQFPVFANTITADQTLCSGQTPALFNGSQPSGGDGLYQYQWASSLNRTQWVSIPGSNQLHFQNGPLTDSVWFRRYVQAGVCPVDSSNEISITVYPPLAGVGIYPDQTICAGMSTQTLLGASPSGGSGSYAYQWISAPGMAGPWSLIPGAVADTLAPVVLHADRYFRRVVVSDAVCSDSGNVVTVRVNAPVTDNIISADQTLCLGSLSPGLNGLQPSGGNGLYQYVWQSSSDSIQWYALPGQTQQHLNTPTLTQTHYFRRLVVSPPCPISQSNSVRVTIDLPLGNNQLLADQTICSGAVASSITGSLPTGGNASYVYFWESSSQSGIWSTFHPMQPTQNLQPGVQVQPLSVRRIVQAGVCPQDTSLAVFIQVDAPVGNNVIAPNQTICQGLLPLPLSGTVPSGGNGTYHYQWHSTLSLPGWTMISGATGQHEQPGMLPGQTWFMRVVQAGVCPPDTSAFVELSFIPQLGDNAIFADQTICYAQQPAILTGSMPSGGNGQFGYEWQMSIDNLNWAQWGGGTAQHLNTGPMVFPLFFRRVVGSGSCIPITSNEVYVHVFPPLGNNIISASETICSGGAPLLFTGPLPTGGVGSYVYNWQSSPNGIHAWVNIPGASQISYQSGPLTSTAYFRRMLISGNCSGMGFGNTIRITVLSVQSLGNNQIAANQTLCYGDAPAGLSGTIPSGGTGSYRYEWLSGNNLMNWFSTGDTTLHYMPSIPLSDTYYRRIVHSGTCRSDSSASLSIQVLPLIGNNQITGESTICSGSVPFVLSGTHPTGGNGGYQYLWFMSSNGVHWIPATGGTTLNYQSPALTSTTYFRRMVISGPCRDTSSSVIVFVLPPLGNNMITPNQTICTGLAPYVITGVIPSGGLGQYFYFWESSLDGNAWVSLPGSTYEHYNAGILNNTAYYRRHVSSGPCYISGDSSLITVLPVVGNNHIAASQTLCFGQQPAAFTGSMPTGGNGIYTYEWHYSFNQLLWFPVNGGSTSNLATGNVFQPHFFRRIVTSGICPSDTTPLLTLTVYPSLSGNQTGSDQTLCAGQLPFLLTGSVTSGGAGIYQYQWLSSVGNSNVWSALPGATGLHYQSDTLPQTTCFRRFVNSNQACIDSGNTVCILVHPALSGNVIQSNQSICSGFPFATLTGANPSGGNGQYQFQWMFSTDRQIWNPVNGAVQADLNGYTLFQTTWFRRILYASPCPPDTSLDVEIRVFDAPSNNIIYADQTLCSSATSFTIVGSTPAGGSGVYQYQWESSLDGFVWTHAGSIQFQTDYTAALPPNSAYFRRILFSHPCQLIYSNTVHITLTPGIFNNLIIADQTLCAGQTPATISGNIPLGGTGIYFYRWESSYLNGNWASVTGAGLPSLLPANDTTTLRYRRIVSSDVCQDTSLHVQILRYGPIADHTLFPAQSICAGSQPLALRGTHISGGSGVYQYVWESSADATSWAVIAGVGADTLQLPALTNTGHYRRRVLSHPCPESVSPTLTIEVTPTTGPNQITPNQTLCMGQVPVQLSGNAPSGGTGQFAFQWESSADLLQWNAIPQATQQQYQPPASAMHLYFRRYMASGACQLYSDTLNVMVNPVPVLSVPDTTICAGDTLQYIAVADIPGGIYTWNTAPFNAQSVQVHPLVTTTYAVDYILNGCFAQRVEPVVRVLPAPAAQITTANQGNFCQGNTTQLRGHPDGMLYQWWMQPGSILVSNAQNITVAQSGTYVLRVTDSVGCTATATLIANQHPAIALSLNIQQPSCSGGNDGSIQVLPNGGMPPYRYLWPSGDTTSQISGLASGQYRLIITDAIGCTLDTLILLTQPSGLSVTDVQTTPIACNGAPSGSASVLVTGGMPPYQYQWSSNPVQNNSSAVNLSAGSYVVVVTDAMGCNTQAIAVITQPSAALQTSIRAPQTQCPGVSDILLTTVQGGTPPYSYQWSPAAVLDNPQAASPFFELQNSTTFTLLVTDAAGCTLTQQIPVTVLEGPVARFEVVYPTSENILRLQQSLILINQSTRNNVSYLWDFGEPEAIDSVFEPTWQYVVTDTYRVTLIVTHENGCKDTAYQVVKYINDPIIHVPNAFSPNGDGINDYFRIAELNITIIEIRFFDRWGNLIFMSPDKEFRWDGTLNGKPLPEGVYTYYLKAFGENGDPVTITGTVTLIR